jgi:sortase A
MLKNSSAALRVIERSFLTLGLILLGFYVLARVHGVVTLHAAMRSFEESAAQPATGSGASETRPDYSLWSPARIKAYKDSLTRHSDPPLAVLRIPKLRIVAPVLDGTDDLTLNSGVGRIPGTARPGQSGNIGIAGHRDGFFRALKDIAKGDTIELVTTRETDVYVVDKVYIAQPDDVNILRPGPKPAVTLVTCYPFYYIGSAPQRYIVQASFKRQEKTAGGL